MRWSITEWPSQGSIAPVSGEERSAIRLGGRWSLAFLAIIVALASSGHAGAEPVYTEVTADAGIDFCHGQLYYEDSVYPCPAPATWEDQFPDHDPRLTPGAAVGDYNRDGWLDLFIGNGWQFASQLYRNNADGTFTDVAGQVGADLAMVDRETKSALFLDYDGDGWLDLFIAHDGGPNPGLDAGDPLPPETSA